MQHAMGGYGVLLAGVLGTTASGGGIIYVDDDAPPGGDGTNWETAHRFLQTALNSAGAGSIDEIRLGQGSYWPDRTEAAPMGSGDEFASFDLVDGVALRGGYAGHGAVDPDALDPALFVTVLDGNIGNPGSAADNTYHIMKSMDVTSTISGCTIQNGNSGNDAGGGIHAVDGCLILTDCRFIDNHAPVGGGFSFFLGDAAVFTRCEFSGNSCDNGGGGADFVNSFGIEFIDCTFTDNSSGDEGAGACLNNSAAAFSSCTFVGNAADPDEPGGGLLLDGSEVTVRDCLFEANSAEAGGGAALFRSSNVSFEDTVFRSNQTLDGFGGLLVGTSTVSLVRCRFIDNVATDLWGGGAGFSSVTAFMVNCEFIGNSAPHSGGGLSMIETDITMMNCLFNGNQSGDGGAMLVNMSEPVIVGTTFTSNASAAGSGAYYNLGVFTETDMDGCIFWGNTAGGVIDQSAQIHVASGALNGSYSCIQELDCCLSGDNNISRDPQFVDIDGPDDKPGNEDDDLRLLATSPCIDAGNNTAIPPDTADLDGDDDVTEATPIDLSGEPRFLQSPVIRDTGMPGACYGTVVVDMGAYESQALSCQADATADGSVDCLDLIFVITNWGGDSLGDVTFDCLVDVEDLVEIILHWGPCPN
jgi:hypothetical protein